MFCQLELLRRCIPSEVRRSLKILPKTLDETYKRILEDIPEMNQEHVKRLLQCLAVAVRPLRVEELAEMLALDWDATEGEVPKLNVEWRSDSSEDQEQELLSTCPSLITIVNSGDSRVIQFSHFSVKEFLTSNRLSTSREDISCYYILSEAAHMTITRASLGVLLSLDDLVNRGYAMSTPLSEYAAEYWVSHARVGSISSHVMDTIRTLFDPDKPHFTAWLQIYDIDRPRRWDCARKDLLAKPLYYSVLCGFYDLVEHLVKKHSQHINTFGGEHDYPLVAALQGGHIRIADLLLQHGANVDFQGTNSTGKLWTPLHSAAALPNDLVAISAVQFLLEHGANVNPRHWKPSETPLHVAVIMDNFELVRMLLQHGAEVNSPDARGRTPLSSMDISVDPVTEESRVNTCQVLLEYGADVNARWGARIGRTLLHDASYLQRPDIVRTLLNHGANVNLEDKKGRTPLHYGLKSYGDPRFAITKLLVKHGADVNARDKYQETPLQLALFPRPETKVVQVLLDNCANVNIEDNWGRTLLHRVCHTLFDYPALKFVQMLLDHGANVHAVDNWGRTPLHQVLGAEDYSDKEHSDVDSQTDEGSYLDLGYWSDDGSLISSSYSASDKCRFAIAQLLVERGADVNAQDVDHETPLHLASRLLSLRVAWILLKHGADINVKNKQGKTPFQLVREYVKKEMEIYPSEYIFSEEELVLEGIALMGLLCGY